jgi:predicted nucleotidyltransferase
MSLLHRFSLFLFSLFPQIQMVALCNSRAMGEAAENSDIDLFIIREKRKSVDARFIVTTITSIFGVEASKYSRT